MNKITSTFVAGITLALFACPALAADTIKLGVPGAHSGDLASYGLPSLNAATLVVEAQNAKGGLLGKQIVLIPQDDQCKPEMATNAATKLISDEVDLVMGHICSGATKAALPFYTDAKIISMSPSATTPVLTLDGQNPHFFRTIVNDGTQANLSAKFIVDGLKAKKIAILHDNGEYGKGYAESNKALLEKESSVEIVLFEAVNPEAVDYSATVRKLKREKVDVVVFGGYHPTASKLLQQMGRDRVRVAFVGPDGLKNDSLITMAGKDAEGVYTTYSSDTSSLPAYKEAQEAHLKKYNAEPGAFFYNAYAATQALLSAIEKAGSVETDKVMDALRNHSVDTPVGTLRFDKNGDPTGVGLSIYQVKDGKFVETEYNITVE